MTLLLLKMLHILVAIFLILVVLLQTGKGAEMGAAFGGASQTVFGSGGPAGFMAKLTTAAAVVFMLTSLSLAYLSSTNRFSGAALPEEMSIPVEQPQQPVQVPPVSEGATDIDQPAGSEAGTTR